MGLEGSLLVKAAALVAVSASSLPGIPVAEPLEPKVYPSVTLTSASALSGSVVRTLRDGEGLPKMFCLVVSSLGYLRSQFPTQGVCGGVEEIGVGFQQWSVTG